MFPLWCAGLSAVGLFGGPSFGFWEKARTCAVRAFSDVTQVRLAELNRFDHATFDFDLTSPCISRETFENTYPADLLSLTTGATNT